MIPTPAQLFVAMEAAPPPAPEPGLPWSRMTRSQRRAAVMRAVAEGRDMYSIATDHSVIAGGREWRMLTLMHSSYLEVQRLRARSESPQPAPQSSPVGILDLRYSSCRWPLWGAERGDADSLYCGAPRDETYPGRYCSHHRRIARRRPGE